LRKADGVRSAEPIAESRLIALLEPWLGPDVGSGDVPLPRLIDVAIDPGGGPDMAALNKNLSAVVAGAAIDDHRVWLERLISLLRAAQTLAVSILALLSAATIGTVVFTTRTGLAIHRDVIEVLHLIGAQDSYIAGQFANRALMLALRGGLIGFGLAVPVLLGMGLVAKNLEAAVLPHLTLSALQWVMLAVLPAIAALIAQATARYTVLRTLAAML
jgi:cell division transport system permease protein